MIDNSLRVVAFSSGSTVLNEPELTNAQDIAFSTYYPGGLFGEASFTVRRDVTRSWQLAVHQRVKFYNGLTCVWEGEIIAISYGPEGHLVRCMGYWGSILMARKWRKPWADNRIDEQAWVWYTTVGSSATPEYCSLDRQNRLRFTPKSIRDAAGAEKGWLTLDYVKVTYTAPTGETIKRITFAYDLQEGAQQWKLGLNTAAGVAWWSVTATGTGTVDYSPVVPVQSIYFYLQAQADQTPPTDGTVYGEVSSIIVRTTTGTITPDLLIEDIRARVTALSATTSLLASNTYSLGPFISEVDSLSDIIARAYAFGDSSLNAWGYGIRESDLGSDDKPVLFAEIQPVLTSYDYSVDRSEIPDAEFEQDITEVRNWIAAEYRTVNGQRVWVTPDDDATLKDTASITAYGQIEEWLSINTTDVLVATNACKRLLAQRKNPQWRCTGTINILASITSASGAKVPACRIRAGERIRVSNFLNDLSGTGLTFLITGTEYDAASLVNSLTVGKPDLLAVYNARLEANRPEPLHLKLM